MRQYWSLWELEWKSYPDNWHTKLTVLHTSPLLYLSFTHSKTCTIDYWLNLRLRISYWPLLFKHDWTIWYRSHSTIRIASLSSWSSSLSVRISRCALLRARILDAKSLEEHTSRWHWSSKRVCRLLFDHRNMYNREDIVAQRMDLLLPKETRLPGLFDQCIALLVKFVPSSRNNFSATDIGPLDTSDSGTVEPNTVLEGRVETTFYQRKRENFMVYQEKKEQTSFDFLTQGCERVMNQWQTGFSSFDLCRLKRKGMK